MELAAVAINFPVVQDGHPTISAHSCESLGETSVSDSTNCGLSLPIVFCSAEKSPIFYFYFLRLLRDE